MKSFVILITTLAFLSFPLTIVHAEGSFIHKLSDYKTNLENSIDSDIQKINHINEKVHNLNIIEDKTREDTIQKFNDYTNTLNDLKNKIANSKDPFELQDLGKNFNDVETGISFFIKVSKLQFKCSRLDRMGLMFDRILNDLEIKINSLDVISPELEKEIEALKTKHTDLNKRNKVMQDALNQSDFSTNLDPFNDQINSIRSDYSSLRDNLKDLVDKVLTNDQSKK